MSSSTPVAVDVNHESQEAQALSVIKKYMAGNAAAGLIAIPLVDLVAIWGIQMAMIRSISHIYEVPFRENAVKTVLASYLGSAGSMTIGYGVFRSLVKWVPGVGVAAGYLAQSASAAAITYALGKVYVMHFEAGGTLLDLDPQKMKSHFEALYKEGIEVAKSMAESPKEPSKDQPKASKTPS